MKIVSKTRKEITAGLTLAARNYFIHRRLSVFTEIGIRHHGRYRADLLAFGLKGTISICEIKSCYQDFKTDKKWKQYLDYCDYLYFCINFEESKKPWFKQLTSVAKEYGVGILVLSNRTGYCYNKKKPYRQLSITDDIRKMITYRLVWRGGDSKRNYPRRVKVFT